MPDPRDVLPTYDADAVLLAALAATPVVILLALTVPAHARRAWGWLCERVARAAYQRGYDVGHARATDVAYATGWNLGYGAGEKAQARRNSRTALELPPLPPCAFPENEAELMRRRQRRDGTAQPWTFDPRTRIGRQLNEPGEGWEG